MSRRRNRNHHRSTPSPTPARNHVTELETQDSTCTRCGALIEHPAGDPAPTLCLTCQEEDTTAALVAVCSEVARLDTQRADILARRDTLIARLIDQGMSVNALSRLTGLSRPAITKRLKETQP